MDRFEYVSPETSPQAIALVRQKEGSVVKAGGVDLLDMMKEGLIAPPRLVNLLSLQEEALRGIRYQPGAGLRIGALTTLAQVASHAAVVNGFPALAQAAGSAATPQLRNMATVGGNLCQRPRCWYFRSEDFPCLRKGGDICYAVEGLNRYHAILGGGPCFIVHPSSLAPALLAFDARVQLVGPDGGREIALEEFFVSPAHDPHRETVLQPGELITQVVVPEPQGTVRRAYREYREKQSYDWALTAAAVALVMEGRQVRDARIVMGAVAPVPWRARLAETALIGKMLSRQTAQQAAAAAVEGAVPMSENEYKLPLTRSVVYRAILHAAGRLLPGDPDR